MTHAGAWVGLYQIKIDGSTVYKCRVLWDETDDVHANLFPEKIRVQLTGRSLGNGKKGDIIEFLCFFGAIAPCYPKSLQ